MLQTADVDAKVIVMVVECHPVSGSSYYFAAAVATDLVVDAEVTAEDLAATTACGSLYFFSAVVAADSVAAVETTTDADVDANFHC